MSGNSETETLEEQQKLPAVPAGEDQSEYSDAFFRTAPTQTYVNYGYNPSRYHTEEEDSNRSPIGIRSVLTICLVCALFASFFGVVGVFLLSRDKNQPLSPVAAHAFYNQSLQNANAAGPLSMTDSSGNVLSGEELYSRACPQTVGITGENQNGSGILLTSDGYILTCYHVIQRCYVTGVPVTVTLADGTSYSGKIVGTESDSDLAVVKIDATGLSPATFGNSELLAVGQRVYALGNPSPEFSCTITRGVISALDRQVSTGKNSSAPMFQFDAALGDGNSGCPVYNESGQVIGIATARYIENGAEGLGFAIPASDAVFIANELIEKGYVSGKAYLGIVMDRTYTPSVARYYRGKPGVYVTRVEDGSAAQTAGLRPGDVITAVDSFSVRSTDDLVSVIQKYRAGDHAVLTVWREGSPLDVSVTFGEAIPSNISP